jgi:AcrR family transcriptional regulator
VHPEQVGVVGLEPAPAVLDGPGHVLAAVAGVHHVRARAGALGELGGHGEHFPSKAALVEAYLHDQRPGGEQVLYRDDLSPRDRLLGLFTERSATEGRIRGCPYHNAAVETAGALPEVQAEVVRHKQEFAARLIETARAAGARNPEPGQPGPPAGRALRGGQGAVHVAQRRVPGRRRPPGRHHADRRGHDREVTPTDLPFIDRRLVTEAHTTCGGIRNRAVRRRS